MAYTIVVSLGAQFDMKFKLRYDTLSRSMTAIFLTIIVAIVVYVYYNSGGSYLPAWITTLTVSIVLLSILSIPRLLILTPFSVEIHCLLEVTRISYDDIRSVKALDNKQMRWCFPFFGIFGIFGYYGYYIDLKHFRTFKIYARRWSNFVMIEDNFDHTYVVSLDDRDTFIEELDKIK